MRRFVYTGLCVFLTLASCVANRSLSDAATAEGNVSNLSRISLGMKESQVLQIMHTPYKQESYRIGKDQYHVWFYITNYTALGQSRLLPLNLTPLTFRNCRLVGTGYSYYHWLQEQKKPFKSTTEIQKKEGELENKPLEETLRKSLKKNEVPTVPSSKTSAEPAQKSPPPAKKAPAKQPPKQNNQGAQPAKPSKEQQKKQPAPPSQQPNHKYPGRPNDTQEQPTPPEKSQQKSYNYGPISMSTPPKKTAPPKDAKPEPSGKPEWNEEDEQMQEEESEQNFDFW